MQILKAEISIIQNVILQILDNYSLNDLLKITKEDLKEVDKELIEQLFKLIKEKVRKKFASSEEDEGYYSQDDEKKNKENILFKKVYQEEEKRDRNKSKQSLQKSKTTETLKQSGYDQLTPHYSNTRYDEMSPLIHHLPGAVPNVHNYQKTYGGGSGMPPINFLGNAGGVNSNPQPSSASGGSNTTTSSKTGNNNSDLNPQGQYKSYQDKTSASGQQQSSGVGQSGAIQHQQQSSTPNYYSQQQAQQVFNSYQYLQNHQYHPHQAHHQGARNRSQYWNQN
ncbi:1101_t:CDS:2 [Entrophospora sp. SA101]|nr:1101_t:CDS:2 [Entrophospora sp. SA101]